MRINFKFILYAVVTAWVSVASAGSYEDFFGAVDRDDARTVSQLLARGFDPNSADPSGQVGLYLALRSESSDVVAVLLAHPSIKIDAVNAAHETPLMMAALRGALTWTQRLVERGAQVNREGWTPLHYAASGPEPKVVAWLLDKGAQIDAPSPNRTTALMMASRYGAIDSATLLLSRGASVAARNEVGLIAADFARTAGRDALVQALESAARK